MNVLAKIYEILIYPLMELIKLEVTNCCTKPVEKEYLKTQPFRASW